MKKEKNSQKFEAILQIVLMLGAIFSFSYFSNEIFGEKIGEDRFEKFYKKILKIVFGKENFVSALSIPDAFGGQLESLANPSNILQQLSDATGGGMSICIEAKNGAKCQVIPKKLCNEQCAAGKCVQVSTPFSQEITNVPEECELGTCQDLEEGTCLPNSPQGDCKEEDGGKWFDDENGNVQQCEPGCCILGSETKLTTELQCQRIANSTGLSYGQEAKFDNSIKEELACIIFGERESGGACVFETENENGEKINSCKFVTRDECDRIGGKFDEEKKLCSDESLETNCEPKDHTACVEGLDEVYWYDSCGNVENIYGTDETGKEGLYISKQESCMIGENGNWLQNQGTCGNCNRIFGSVCGEEISEQELSDDPDGNVVCRDLGCMDRLPDGSGVRREHGETWCAYQTDFGVFPFEVPNAGALSYLPGGTSFLGGLINSRSIGPPGSQFFRKSCIEGNVTVETCAEARQGICVETREQQGNGKGISVASCRANRWQECVNYNPPDRGEGFAGKIKVQAAMIQCEADPDCFVKNVDVGKDFSFPVCLPKYPPGFDIGGDGSGESVCGYASQTCPAIFVKEAVAGGFGGAVWVCKANCDCVTGNDPDSAQPSEKFVKEMSDFCTSLGDCGMKINYEGTPGALGSFVLKKCVTGNIEEECKNKMPVFSLQAYLGTVLSLALQAQDVIPKKDKFIDAGDIEVFAQSLGASSSGPLSFFAGTFGIDDLLNMVDGSDSSNIPKIGGYKGKDLPAIGGVAGATPLGFWALGKTGVFSTTTYALNLPSGVTSVASMNIYPTQAAAQAAQAQYNSVGLTGSKISAVKTMSPGMQSFSSGLTGAMIAIAAASILMAVSGIGAGLGKGWTYGYLGAAGVGGGLTGIGAAGLPHTFAAGSPIPAGTPLVPSASFTVPAGGPPAFVGPGTYTITPASGAPIPLTVPAGGTAPIEGGVLVTTGPEGGALVGGPAAAGPGGAAGAAPGSAIIPGASTLLAVGIVILVIVFIMIILNWVSGVGKMKKVEVSSECKPWQPPIGATSTQCNKCGEDGFPCNDYACKSLGANCALVGEHPNIICEDMSPNDVTGPTISQNEDALEEGFESTETGTGIQIRKIEGRTECLEDFQSASFGINSEEFSYCKIGFDPLQKFEEIPTYMNGENKLKKEHSHTISSLDIVNYFDSVNDPIPSEQRRDATLYIKCIDAKGNPSPYVYSVELCVVRADWTAPFLTYMGNSEEFLTFGATTKHIVVRSNEPVEMRWGFEDEDFELMENRMTCPISESLTDCWADIPISADEMTVYVRAKDHYDWIGTEREAERNKNEQSLPIVIKRTDTQLKIESVVPGEGGIFTTSLLVFTVNVEVHVSGGHKETTSCYFGDGGLDRLNKESVGVYKKSYERYTPGTHTLTIECADNYGNVDKKVVNFEIRQDLMNPTISRIYDEDGTLVLITNEKATCGFRENFENRCVFSLEDNGINLFATEDSGMMHTLSNYNPSTIYYIKCKDEYGNERATECLTVSGGI